VSHSLKTVLLSVLIGCGPKPAPVVAADPAPVATDGSEEWHGVVDVPAMPLKFTANLTSDGGGWSGVINIPMQGAVNVPLVEVASSPTDVRFVLEIPGAKSAVFEASRTGDAASGVLKQMGQEFPLTMRNGEPPEVTGPNRPQTPKGPFPYVVAEATYTHGDMTIGGTLTKPEGEGPFPAALLITGSGAQDRDETIFAHKPFAVIADHLTRKGIAVLRVDDRGVGQTSGRGSDATSKDLVADVLAGVTYLKNTDGIDPERIGLIGHSEGGILGPQAAAEKKDDIAFVVMLAGTGLPGRDILMMQGRTMYESSGTTGDELESLLELHAAALDATPEARAEAVTALLKGQLTAQGMPTEGEQFEQMAEGAISSFASPWFESFVALDPRVALKQVKCPVLALNGSLDFQVPPEVNLTEIKKALVDNPDVTIQEFEGLNHLFQPAKTGLLDEYGEIETTIAPEVLEVVTDWIRARTGLQ